MEEANNPAQPDGMPYAADPFVGREAELAEITRLLADPACRLLTLVGVGGVGKTRLATEVAAAVKSDYPDGVFFVPLAAVDDGSLLVPALADVFNLQLVEEQDVERQLFTYLRDRQLLLLLDGFEQLHEAAGQLSMLLQAAPRLHLLVTSREALNLGDEWLFAVDGLPYPAGPEEEDLERYGAVSLFLHRARQVRPGFSLEKEAPAIVRICWQTEGLPLALELAASWVRTMRCADIAEEIQENLDFLTSRLQDVPAPHRSMRAVFRQSWDRLRQAEQTVFAGLSVFQGGFQRPAAERVAGAGLASLSALVDRSLVRLDPDGRYRIHELLRQYGAEQLARSHAELEKVREAHSRTYVRFLQERTEALRGGRQLEALREIDVERENVRLAWQWAVDRLQVEQIGVALEPLNQFYDFRGHYLEGIRALEAAVEALKRLESPERRTVLAPLYNYLAGLYMRVGRLEEAERDLRRCRDLYEALAMKPPPGYASDPHLLQGLLATIRGQFERAEQLGQEALAVARQDNHLLNQQIAHYLLARAALLQGRLEEARTHAQHSYALTRSTRDRWFMAYCLNELGNVALQLGDYHSARQHYRTSYKIRREFQDPEGMAVALSHLGTIAYEEEQYDEAERLQRESLSISREIANRGSEALALHGLARTALAREDEVAGCRFLRQALGTVREGQFSSLFLTLLVDIAFLFRRQGNGERASSLLALVVAHPGAAPEAREKAQAQLAQVRGEDSVQPPVPPDAEWPALEQLLLTLQATLELSRGVEETRPLRPDPRHEGKGEAATATGDDVLVEPLTEREAEVLHLIAAGLSNAEIAEQLVIAVGTVKYYTSEIYGKLGVRNRVEAASRARELGLLH